MRRRTYHGILSIFVFAGSAHAQQGRTPTPPAQLTTPITISPSHDKTRVLVVPAREEEQEGAQGEFFMTPEEARSAIPAKLRRWHRLSGGFWASLGNAYVLRSHSHVSSDTVLFDHATEFGYGAGGLIDAPLPSEGTAQALRFRAGIHRLSITPDDELSAATDAPRLEGSALVFSLSALYKAAPNYEFSYGTLWFGGGFQLSHVFSTSYDAGTGTTQSQLRGSYGINLIAAVGLEMPISNRNDFGLELDWKPWSGWQLLASIRTPL